MNLHVIVGDSLVTLVVDLVFLPQNFWTGGRDLRIAFCHSVNLHGVVFLFAGDGDI